MSPLPAGLDERALEEALRERPRAWALTGVAGFVGSHLLERLLSLGQRVRGIDDLSTGSPENLAEVRATVGEEAWGRFSFERASVADPSAARRALAGAELVLHQAALGSVPRSIADPLSTLEANVGGFVAVASEAARAGLPLVFASSSSVYGDAPGGLRREGILGRPLSPYAASKRAGELLAHALAAGLGLRAVGLRYFNVIGPRQRADGPYAAVVPRWIAAWLEGEAPELHGDGGQTRDFTPVEHVVRANLRAALLAEARPGPPALVNVGLGRGTALRELARLLRAQLAAGARAGEEGAALFPEPLPAPARPGDVRHARADPSLARGLLGLAPAAPGALPEGLRRCVRWARERRARESGRAWASLGPSESAG